MATELNNKVIRESTVEADGRKIIISLNEDQTISFKLKGMKSGVVSIPIQELYAQLTNGSATVTEKPKTVATIRKKDSGDYDGGPLIPLNRFRSLNAITPGKAETIARVDELVVIILDEIQNGR